MSYNIAHPSIYLLHRLSSLLPNVTFPAIPPSAPSFLLPPLSFLSFSRSLSLSRTFARSFSVLLEEDDDARVRLCSAKYRKRPRGSTYIYIYIYIDSYPRVSIPRRDPRGIDPLSLSLHRSPLRVFGKGRIKKLV